MKNRSIRQIPATPEGSQVDTLAVIGADSLIKRNQKNESHNGRIADFLQIFNSADIVFKGWDFFDPLFYEDILF